MKLLLYFLVGMMAIFIIALLLTFPTKWLWNWLMPNLFGLQKITLLQAFGISMLSKILFGSTSYSSKN